MRPSSLTYVLLGVLVFATAYRILNQPSFPNLPPDQFDVSGQYPFEQKTDPLPITKMSHSCRTALWCLRMWPLTNWRLLKTEQSSRTTTTFLRTVPLTLKTQNQTSHI